VTGKRWILGGWLALLLFSLLVPKAWSKGKIPRSKTPAHQKGPGPTGSPDTRWQDDEDREVDLSGREENQVTGSRFKEEYDDTYEENIPAVKNESRFKEETEDTDTDTEGQDEP
jgi:hypothetical protein